MQSQPQTEREIIASLRHQVIQAQAGGLSRVQAIAAVSHRHHLSPIKLGALLYSSKRSEHA
jgi:hypothetical protein